MAKKRSIKSTPYTHKSLYGELWDEALRALGVPPNMTQVPCTRYSSVLAGRGRDPRVDSFFDDDDEDVDAPESFPKPADKPECEGCAGKGIYTGFRSIENPCSYCGGYGKVP